MRVLRKEKNNTALLAEYKLMRSEIDGYFKLRNTILTILVSSMGLILGLAEKVEPIYKVIALNLVLFISLIMTCSYTLIARRKSAYIKVFVEDKIMGLNWFSVSIEDSEEYLWLKKIFKKLHIPFDSLPHEYPLIYFFLGAIVVIYSYHIAQQTNSEPILYITYSAAFILFYYILYLQYAVSNFKYRSLIEHYKLLFNKSEV